MIFRILIQNKMAIAVLFFKKILKNLLTFCGDSIIFIVATIKGGGENMSPRTGRPKMENAKDTMFRVRLDDKTIEDLDFCAKSLDTTKSEIVRKGIKLVKSEIEANKFTKIP